MPSRARRLLGLTCLAPIIFTAVLTVEAAEKVTPKVIVKDALTMPMKPVTLAARVVKHGMLGQTPLGGENVEFFVDGVSKGVKLTGGDGWAFVPEVTVPMRGNHIIRVKVIEDSRVEGAEATGNLAVWERRRPILFVELAALIEEGKLPVGLPAVPLRMGMTSLPAPLEGAPKNLDKLTKYYFNVVYLSRTGSVPLEILRDWLREHKFPQGVPRVLKPGKEGLATALEEFKEQGFTNIKGGIGRARDFAEVFAQRRVKVVILSAEGEDREYPRRTKWAKDWLEARRHIQT